LGSLYRMADLVLRAAEAFEINAVLAFWRIAAENGHRPADTAGAIATLHLRDPDALILAVDGTSTGWRSPPAGAARASAGP
jgi:hypothetical protein